MRRQTRRTARVDDGLLCGRQAQSTQSTQSTQRGGKEGSSQRTEWPAFGRHSHGLETRVTTCGPEGATRDTGFNPCGRRLGNRTARPTVLFDPLLSSLFVLCVLCANAFPPTAFLRGFLRVFAPSRFAPDLPLTPPSPGVPGEGGRCFDFRVVRLGLVDLELGAAPDDFEAGHFFHGVADALFFDAVAEFWVLGH